jgi:hypothetical protein
MVVKFINTICPPQPQLSLHRRAALSSNSNGTRSYIAGRTQSAVYVVRCLWPLPPPNIYCPEAENNKWFTYQPVIALLKSRGEKGGFNDQFSKSNIIVIAWKILCQFKGIRNNLRFLENKTGEIAELGTSATSSGNSLFAT